MRSVSSSPAIPFGPSGLAPAVVASCLLLAAGCMAPPPIEEVPPDVATSSPRHELAPDAGSFTLLWEDHFDEFDTERWSTGSHTWNQNDSQFSPDMVEVADGLLTISLVPNEEATGDDRPYLGGELRTNEAFLYGRFETRAKFAKGSGVVSSFFTYYDHWGNPALEENWNELDIEFLGKDSTAITFNIINWDEAQHVTQRPVVHELDFDPSDDFHDYAIEWLPDVVHFYVDGQLAHSQTSDIADRVNLEQRLMMNVWPVRDTPGLNAWAGKVDEDSVPTFAQYDVVRVYSWR